MLSQLFFSDLRYLLNCKDSFHLSEFLKIEKFRNNQIVIILYSQFFKSSCTILLPVFRDNFGIFQHFLFLFC